MRKKQVWRYYCEFCKKASCSGGHMKKHEEHCTMNPNRVCGVCKMLEETQPIMSEMVALLPNMKSYEKQDEFVGLTHYGFEEVMTPALEQLRKKSNNCPACILSAIRQAGIFVSLVTGFDYKKESSNVLAEYNHDREENYAY